MKIAVLPGDGIGTEIVSEAVKVLEALELPFEMESALVGGAAYEGGFHLERELQRFQNLDGFGDDFGANAVTWQNCDFHEVCFDFDSC